MTTIYTYNGQVLKEASTDKWLAEKQPDPYNPLCLPSNTVRVRTSDGQPPSKVSGYYSTTYETATLVTGTSDIYDVYKSGTSFDYLLYGSSNLVEVLGANTSGVTSMYYMLGSSNVTTVQLFDTSSVTDMSNMFRYAGHLTSAPMFDTSSVTSMGYMFSNCYALTNVPLLNTSNVTSMIYMFASCYAVESGALALYQQASTQTNPPANHMYTFYRCGRDTTTGAAELAQIPANWGGTQV